ncbi:MAG TPA: hypothetical protein DCE75_07640 [Acidimicrobiaceae bacterium]|nr:hypothetical protein [Acidimicrobiaceae bacterium]
MLVGAVVVVSAVAVSVEAAAGGVVVAVTTWVESEPAQAEANNRAAVIANGATRMGAEPIRCFAGW